MHVDFDLHGFVGVRVLDPRPRDVAMVTGQLGPMQSPLNREPDITVRFVDRIDDPRRLTYVTWPEGGFTDDTFYVLRGRGNVPTRAAIPFADVGKRCDLVCQRRAGPVPHLLAIVNLTALTHGVLPLHASAFVHDGQGILATGWAKGGKTETLLAFASKGAQYVGDEWVYLTPDGNMYGVPEPIRLWAWQVRQLPQLVRQLPVSTRARLTGFSQLSRVAQELGERLPAGRLPASVLRRGAPILGRQAYVRVPPADLFGADAITLEGRLDRVLLVASHDRPAVTLDPVDGSEVGQRMLASLAEERAQFMAGYHQFRYAFPARSSPSVEQAAQRERELLDRCLRRTPAYVLRHPYPLDLHRLVEPVEALLRRPPAPQATPEPPTEPMPTLAG